MKKIFFNSEHHLKAIFQIVIAIILYFLIQIVVMIGLSGIIVAMSKVMGQDEAWRMAVGSSPWFGTLAMTLVNVVEIGGLIWLYRKMNQTTCEQLGLNTLGKGGKDLGVGLLLGAGTMSVIAAILYGIGDMKFGGIGWQPSILYGLAFYISVGIVEEVLVRGYFQRVIEREYGIGVAILIPSAIFSVMHFLNPNISYVAALNIFLVGILFGMMTYKSGNLWMAIGYHITWNFFQGTIYSIEVSGTTLTDSLVRGERVVDSIWNGGAFGAEGGLICTLLLIVSIVYFLWKYEGHDRGEHTIV